GAFAPVFFTFFAEGLVVCAMDLSSWTHFRLAAAARSPGGSVGEPFVVVGTGTPRMAPVLPVLFQPGPPAVGLRGPLWARVLSPGEERGRHPLSSPCCRAHRAPIRLRCAAQPRA